MKVAATVIATAAVMALAVGVAAAAPLPASGTGTAGAPVFSDVHMADGNLVADFAQTGTIVGTFDGTFETTGRVIVYADGRAVVHGFVDFTGTTPCGAGSVTFVGMDATEAGVGSGRVETTDAATDTAGIHAQADLVLVGPAFTYTGTYSCRA
jgi:hypothetical protein